MAATYESLHRLVAASYRWFSTVPREVHEAVLKRGRRLSLEVGDRVYSRGDSSNGMYMVLDGAVRMSGIAPSGQMIVLDFYGPAVWFGEVATFGSSPRLHDVEAYLPTTLLHLNRADVEALIAEWPALSRSLLTLFADRLHLMVVALESYSTDSFERRLASRLLMLSTSFGKNTGSGIQITLHLPQETLAELIGASRQRVNQILHAWEEQRILAHHYGRLMLLDMTSLEELAS